MASLQAKNISIQFPGVKALDNVSVDFPSGKVTALCGENGAGKSTLGKIIAGIYPPEKYQGEILLDGQKLDIKNTLEAEKKGIAIIHQELNLINDMTVAENIFLSQIPHNYGVVNYNKMRENALVMIKELEIEINPDAVIRDLTVSKRQIVEIIKGLSKNPQVLIFDEATSSLTESEVEILFGIIKKLKEKKVTMIFVTHKLDEIFECCDHVVILKDGKFILEKPVQEMVKADIIRGMVGRELSELYPPKQKYEYGEEVLRVEDWTVYDGVNKEKEVVKNVAFELHAGEILGIYGLVGAGRTELIQSLFEGKEIKSKGRLYLKKQEVQIRNVADAIEKKMALVTEDRKKTGLVLCMNIKNNIALASLNSRTILKGAVDQDKENKAADDTIAQLKVKVPSSSYLVSQLSGGNQQKVVLGKWLLTQPEILILDEPTRGIDVGTKAEIYRMLREFTQNGMSVIVVSGEMPEILGISDRILVMQEGKITGTLYAEEASEILLAQYALGGTA